MWHCTVATNRTPNLIPHPHKIIQPTEEILGATKLITAQVCLQKQAHRSISSVLHQQIMAHSCQHLPDLPESPLLGERLTGSHRLKYLWSRRWLDHTVFKKQLHSPRSLSLRPLAEDWKRKLYPQSHPCSGRQHWERALWQELCLGQPTNQFRACLNLQKAVQEEPLKCRQKRQLLIF